MLVTRLRPTEQTLQMQNAPCRCTGRMTPEASHSVSPAQVARGAGPFGSPGGDRPAVFGYSGQHYAVRRGRRKTTTAAVPREGRPPSTGARGEAQASSSAATLRVRLGSTWTPGPMVVETVTFFR